MSSSNMSRYSYILAIIKQINGFYGYLALSAVIRVVNKFSSASVGIAAACFIGKILDSDLVSIKTISTILVLLIIVKILFSYLDTYVSHDMSFKILTRLRNKVYDKIDELAPGGIEGNTMADYATVIASDINVFEWFYAHILVEWIGTIIFSITMLIITFGISPTAFLVSLIGMIVMFIIPTFSVGKSEEKGYVMKRLFGALNGIVADGVQGLKDIIGFHWEETFLSKLNSASQDYAQTQKLYSISSSKEKRSYSFLTDFCILLSTIIVLLIGKSSLTTVFLQFSLISAILVGIQETLSQGTNYGFVFGAAKRVFDILNSPVPVSDHGDLNCEDVVHDKNDCYLKFDNVCFSYDKSSDKKVLNGVSFNVCSGERVAIVSASGGGKTTSAKLIQRFWDIDSGEITINGINIKDIKLSELRKIVTVVPQETYLFNGTIKDNMLLVKPDATDDEIERAIRVSQANQFIDLLENGIMTVVGENGTLLSGGERQRIALAQAILANTPILVLDEATSALDAENESIINKEIKQLGTNRTVIVIAHRLSTIMDTDKIVFILDNKVNQVGTYNDLIKSNQKFKELVRGEYIEQKS